MTLRRQMIVLIAGPALVIYIAILGLSAAAQYRQSRQEVEQAATRLAASYSARLDGYLREVSRIAETTARLLGSEVAISDEKVFELLENNVRQTQFVYGSCLAFEPGTRRPADELFGPYVYRDEDGLQRMVIDQSVYDWYRDPAYTWYSHPKELGRGVWSAPYFDEGAGNILMSTYSAPFRSEGEFGGVCTVDINLSRLRETVGREIDEQLDFVILAEDGRYFFHPDSSQIMARTMLEYEDHSGGDLAGVTKRILDGEAGAAWLDGWETDEPVGLFFAPISSTGWMFVARVPEETVLSGVRSRTIAGAGALVAALALIAGAIWIVAGRIAAPIAKLEQKVGEISGGHLEARIESAPSNATEIRSLSESFNRMTSDLRANVERLAVEASERQRIERDLDLARQIQRGLLPRSKPDLAEYDIAGWSRSADQTGGDYFDWQVLPDGQILVSLADVSGHGIGPALVAAVCRAYARASIGGESRELSMFMRQLNELLIDDLPDGRFVTFVGALLDPARHRVQLLSAGHGPMYRCMASQSELIELGADDLPLGVIPGNPYGPATEYDLSPGDSMLLITDGLFEWLNEAGEAFGLERLRNTIRTETPGDSEQLIQTLYERARTFAGNAPQLDDVTIVVIRRRSEAEKTGQSS